jgi:hypothetical protein
MLSEHESQGSEPQRNRYRRGRDKSDRLPATIDYQNDSE